jgi:hypothetical protein
MPHEAHEDPAALLAELRTRVENAAGEIAQLTAELANRDACIDELENALDAVLGLVETPIVVAGDDLRIRALSRGAVQRLGPDAEVGKPLSSVVPDDVFARVEARRSAGSAPDEPAGATYDPPAAAAGRSGSAGGVVHVEALPAEGAIVMLPDGNRDRTSRTDSRSRPRRRGSKVVSDGRREHGRRARRSR